MPFANLVDDLFRTQGMDGILGIVKRAVAPAGNVMREMSPSAGVIANQIAGIEDDTAKGMGRYLSGALNLDRWEKIAAPKRVLAGQLAGGDLTGDHLTRALADPEITGLAGDLRSLFAQTNAENLAATDHLGNPLQVRNPFTGEKRDYQPIAENYFPRFVKREKRNAVLEPMRYVQADLERSLTRSALGNLGLDDTVSLDPIQQEQIRSTASEAINEFLRTGTPNDILKDKKLVNAMEPAYKGFLEITDHLRKLQLARAEGRGQGVPDEMDPIIQLFGSDDPEAQRSGIRMFRDFLLRDAQNARRFGSIESSRALPLPRDWYERDPLKVGPLYAYRQQRRLAEIKRFGQDNEVVLDKDNGLLSQIADDRDREFSKKIFERAMGLEPYNKSLAMNKLMDGIFASQVVKLGTAQIAQLGQIMNVIMETGLGPTWKALGDLGKSKDIALKSGASLTRIMDIVREGLADPLEETGARKFTEGFLKWTGFNKADLLARHIGAGAGYAHGQEILRRAVADPNDVKALREIRRLSPGMNASPGAFEPILQKIAAARRQLGPRPSLDQIEQVFGDELSNIARTASLNANFRQSILDMPGWSTTPLGRMVTMFRGFAYRQTNFIKDRVIQDWKAGNPRPLIGLAAGAGVLGPLVNILKSVPQGRAGEELTQYGDAAQDPKKALLKGVENIATVGAMGLFDQMARAVRRGDLGWWEFMGGPVFSDISQMLSGTGRVVGGATGYLDSERTQQGAQQLGRLVSSHIPVVGGLVGKGLRAATEDVTRLPSGLVTREGRQPLGIEAPPLEIGGLTLPSPRVLLGLDQPVTAKRQKYMDEIKVALEGGERQKLGDILKRARADGVIITATSVKRLVREQALKAREEAAGG